MLWTARTRSSFLLVVVLVIALAFAACSDDLGSAPTEAPVDPPPSGDDSDLVVPLDYLQGEWCNSDGEAWLFEGDTARFGESHEDLVGQMPIAGLMAAGSQRVLVSQTDDEFVLDLDSRQLTFTRGGC